MIHTEILQAFDQPGMSKTQTPMEFKAVLNLLLFTHLSFQDDSRVYST